MIRLCHAGYRYRPDSPPVLDDVNLAFGPGETAAIVGPNGSGKSTLARLLNGLLLPSVGRVMVDDLDTTEASPAAIRQRVSLVWQNPDTQLVCGVVEDDVAFGPENLGLPAREVNRRVDDALECMDLDSLRLTSTDQLSAGQRQLVAVAGILALKPRYLILDEATARLDSDVASRLLNAVLGWARADGTGVIMITHRMSEVLRADWLHHTVAGRVVASGRPDELLRQAQFTDDELLQTPLYDTIFRLEQLGIRLDHTPTDVHDLVDTLCR